MRTSSARKREESGRSPAGLDAERLPAIALKQKNRITRSGGNAGAVFCVRRDHMPDEPVKLKGLRREIDRNEFEELGALQCAVDEILGYVGTTERKLEAWCRKIYKRPLKVILPMIRQDGLIAIRRASFEQLKKSATIISQQYNRFLPDAGRDPRESAEAAIRTLTAAMAPAEKDLRALYAEPEGEDGEA